MATYRSVADGVAQRVRMGAPLKVQGVEIGAIRISSTPQARDAAAGVFLDDGTRDEEREKYYEDDRRVMLVHAISRSNREGQLYDVVIYLVPHVRIEDKDPDKTANLLQVVRVEYYFGGAWHNRIFPSIARENGFAVSTAAYGPFL